MTANFEALKQEMDSYGVGVRAGAITPTPADEDYFRSKAGLPPTSDEAMEAWAKENNVRRPITLANSEGTRQPVSSFAGEKENEE